MNVKNCKPRLLETLKERVAFVAGAQAMVLWLSDLLPAYRSHILKRGIHIVSLLADAQCLSDEEYEKGVLDCFIQEASEC